MGKHSDFRISYFQVVDAWRILADLRRPEGPPRGAPYSNTYRKEKEFLMVIMESGIARGRVRT